MRERTAQDKDGGNQYFHFVSIGGAVDLRYGIGERMNFTWLERQYQAVR